MKILKILATLLLTLPVAAQQTKQGNISAANAACIETACVQINLSNDAATVAVQLSGTFSATLKPEKTVDGTTWVSAGSDLTSAGVTTYNVPAHSSFRVRASAYVSGLASVQLRQSNGVFASGAAAGSSGDFQVNNGSGGLSAVTAANVPNGAPTDDNAWVGNGTAWEKKALAAGMVSYNTTGNAIAGRTITGTSPVAVSNGDGISGNPTISWTAGGMVLSRPGGITTTLTGWPVSSNYAITDFILPGGVCTGDGATGGMDRPCGDGGVWQLTNSGSFTGSMAGIATPDAAHPGIRIIRSGATTNDRVEFAYSGAGSLNWDSNFDSISIVSPENSDANTQHRFGIASNPSITGTASVHFEKLFADSNWFFVCRNASTETRTDTSVAHGTGWFTARIRRVNASTVGFAIVSGVAGTLPAETQVTTNCPSGSGTQVVGAYTSATSTTATKGLKIDYHDMVVTGIVR